MQVLASAMLSAVSLLLLSLSAVVGAQGQCVSRLVFRGADGKLVYVPDAQGNRIPDFSSVGYKSGTVAIPTVPVKASVEPAPGDAGSRIQAAIDQVSALPADENGFRGAVLLKAGEYPIQESITMRTGGVVLRGEGRELTGTILRATGTLQRSLVQIAGAGSLSKVPGTEHHITDEYVPVGAGSFLVDSSEGLSVGDAVIVQRPSTAEWIQDIGMDLLDNPWQPGSKDLKWDRMITRIEGNQITVDAPLTSALEQQYGGGTIFKYTWPERIENVGVENLRGVSDFTGSDDEDHAWSFIELQAVANAWVRSITAEAFVFSAVLVGRSAKWVTVEDSANLDPVSLIAGGRRYSFNVEGQLTLVKNCRARQGRHDFVLGSVVPGPNVFVDGLAEQAFSDTGPHHRWSAGTLFDNIVVRGNTIGDSGRGHINVRNRGNSGTGHGWAGANVVVWNSTADGMIIENPPTAQNWAIGAITPNPSGDGIWDSFGCAVEPRSLYFAQLEERLRSGPTDSR